MSWARWLLSSLGAAESSPGSGAVLLDGLFLPSGGLPLGTLEYANGLALACAALAGVLTGRRCSVAPLGVALQVWLPEVMAASYHSPTAMRPAPPTAAPGGGWYHADLGSPGARDDFARLLSVLPPDVSAAALAAAAQEWRLPVCDYRPFRAAPPVCPVSWTVSPALAGPAPAVPAPAVPAGAVPAAAARGLRVLDLTNMWAGPLATWLLGSVSSETAGFAVTIDKVEPSFRPDGFRGIAGGGIYPSGRSRYPGQDSAMWNALNRGKRRLDLDLRDPSQLSAFMTVASSADVVIDSFSPRVMHNFGLVSRLLALPRPPLLVSMPAFPPGPERDWVAFGNGVHAVLGLGDRAAGGARGAAGDAGAGAAGGAGAGAAGGAGAGAAGGAGDGSDSGGSGSGSGSGAGSGSGSGYACGAGRFGAPPVSYPDPLAGFAGALAVLAGIVGRLHGNPVASVEVTLAGASQPLLSAAGAARPAGAARAADAAMPPGLGADLLELATSAGLLETVDVVGQPLLHPRSPFHFSAHTPA